MIAPRQAGLDARKTFVVFTLIVGKNAIAFGQGDGPKSPQLTSTKLILKGDSNAMAFYPVFGKLAGSDEASLLVGTGDNGKDTRGRLRVLRSVGTQTKPSYGDGYWLDEKVPSAPNPWRMISLRDAVSQLFVLGARRSQVRLLAGSAEASEPPG